MTAATTARIAETAGRYPAMGTLPSAANQLFYKNTLVARDANGRAVVPTDGDGLPVVGRAIATFDNRIGSEAGGTDDDLDIEIVYDITAVEYTGTAPVSGSTMYSVDNQTMSIDSDSGARGFGGVCTEVRDGQAFVQLSPLSAVISALLDRVYALENP